MPPPACPWTVARLLSTLYPRLRRPVFIVGVPGSGTTFRGECIAALPEISFLARAFSDATFVHIVRDGRDAALSYSKKPWLLARSEAEAGQLLRRLGYVATASASA